MIRVALVACGVALAALPAWAQPASDSGLAGMRITTSGYVDLTAGGPAGLTGSMGGNIIGNTAKGTPLTGLTIEVGEVGPVNASAFVKVTLPLRLRSNTAYALSMRATPIDAPNPHALQSQDIGFGMGEISRGDANVLPGEDAVASGLLGDPTMDPDAEPNTARWDYRPGKRLSDYANDVGILTGPVIMRPSPQSQPDGLTLNLYFCIRPQFFAPGNFSSTITLTITTP